MTATELFHDIYKWLKPILVSFVLLLIVVFIYVNVTWYLSVLIVSIISLWFFPRIYGVIIRAQFRFYLSELKFKNLKLTIIVSLLTFLCWWFFWIFWIDLNLNQIKWVITDIPLIPIDYFKVSQIDLQNICFLFFHPSKVISFLSVYYENGYFTVLGFRPSGKWLLILWLLELKIMYNCMLGEILKILK